MLSTTKANKLSMWSSNNSLRTNLATSHYKLQLSSEPISKRQQNQAQTLTRKTRSTLMAFSCSPTMTLRMRSVRQVDIGSHGMTYSNSLASWSTKPPSCSSLATMWPQTSLLKNWRTSSWASWSCVQSRLSFAQLAQVFWICMEHSRPTTPC